MFLDKLYVNTIIYLILCYLFFPLYIIILYNGKNEYILAKYNVCELGSKIKIFFNTFGSYVVIRNYDNLTDNEIINLYETLNKIIGEMIPIDLNENTYVPTMKYWSNVKYEYGFYEKQFWRSSNHQNLHTDNTFASKESYANLTELVLHGRSSFIGIRHYIKAGIRMPDITLVDYKILL